MQINPLRKIGIKAFCVHLEEAGPSLSFKRLCTSRHVDDLQSVASVALGCLVLALLAMIALIVFPGSDGQVDIVKGFVKFKDDIVPFAGAIAVLFATLSWTYQTGSKRLGAVDLFASEIGAISRVCLVVDFAKSSVRQARSTEQSAVDRSRTQAADRDPLYKKFTSEEHYTPVYDNNTSDLQALDFDVVTEVTQFYTYRKSMMDYMRKIATIDDAASLELLRRHMIYMQFLMYESARKALVRLIEFEPDQSEAVANAYCNELALFAYLKRHYGKDFQGERLKLRRTAYDTDVRSVYRHITGKYEEAVNKAKVPNVWEKANAIAPELMARFLMMRHECEELSEPSPASPVEVAAE